MIIIIIMQIFYINLPHRKDRKKNVIQQVTKVDRLEDLERVDGVYGDKINIKNMSSSLVTKQGKRQATAKNIRVYVPLTVGAIGCALSHRKVYQKIIDQDLDYALILEDDITLDKNFNTKFEEIMRNAPSDFDVIYLGYHNSSLKNIKPYSKHFSIPDRVYGLFGYVVTRQAAEKLLKVFPITRQIDSDISDRLNSNKPGNIRAYITQKRYRIIVSDESDESSRFGTDIQHRHKMHRSLWSRMNRRSKITLVLLLVLILAACLSRTR